MEKHQNAQKPRRKEREHGHGCKELGDTKLAESHVWSYDIALASLYARALQALGNLYPLKKGGRRQGSDDVGLWLVRFSSGFKVGSANG